MPRKNAPSEYNLEEIKSYMALPASKKLLFLEEMNDFFRKVTPPDAKKAWDKLRSKGW